MGRKRVMEGGEGDFRDKPGEKAAANYLNCLLLKYTQDVSSWVNSGDGEEAEHGFPTLETSLNVTGNGMGETHAVQTHSSGPQKSLFHYS